jgi:hypothetical protein
MPEPIVGAGMATLWKELGLPEASRLRARNGAMVEF